VLGRGVRAIRRRASFSTRFAVILAVLGVMIAGATAAIPLQLSASQARDAALQRAADRAGSALNLVTAQRIALEEYAAGLAQQLAQPLAEHDLAGATQLMLRQSVVTGDEDALGASFGDGQVVRNGSDVSADDIRSALLQAVRTSQSTTVDGGGTPWLLERAPVPGVDPVVEAFIARPMNAGFVRQLDANIAGGAEATSLAVVRDGTFMSGTTAGAPPVSDRLVPAALTPVLRNQGGAVLVRVGDSDVAGSAVDLGGGVVLLVTTPVNSDTGFGSSAVLPVAVIAVAMILVAMLVVYVVVQRDLQRPLRRLDRAVAGLEREDFDVPIPSGGDDELGRLGSSFERMRAAMRATLAGAEARASIAGELNAAQPLQTALERVCALLRSTTGAQAALIAVSHSDMADAFTASAGLESPVEPATVLNGGGPVSAVLDGDAGTPLMAAALAGTGELAAGMREMCVARLRIGMHVLGALAIADKPGGFNAADSVLVVAAAEQVALALERYRILAVAQRQASTDELTGLYNYRFLVDYLDQQIALAERLRSPLAVLMLDLDRFKVLNDSHGHHAGDEALRAFAQSLHSTIRRSDLAARYGGEEFVVVMANTNREEARLVAEKIRNAVSGLDLDFNGTPLHFTVSIGGVAYPDDTGDARQLLELADDALYQAKRGGRNRVCFVSDAAPRRTLAGAGGHRPAESHEDADEHDTGHRPAQ
jgi:diguanylate cyclase (GGDEF)-like protein